jgi:hypothetical protein
MEHYYTFKDATARKKIHPVKLAMWSNRKKIHPVKLAMWSNTAFNDELQLRQQY